MVRSLLCLLLMLGSAHAAVPTPITLTGEPVDLQVGRQLVLYSAPDDRYDPQSLPPDELFTASEKNTHSLGYSNKTHWTRFRLHNSSERLLHLTLRQGYALIDQLTLVRINSDGSRETVVTGDHHPFAERPLPQASFVFPLSLDAGEMTDIYLSYHSEGQVNIDLRLQDNAALIEDLEGENLLKGAYFGGMLALVLYNLFLFWAIRDANYLRYVVYTAFYSLLQVSYNGIAFEYFWPDAPWWSNASLNMIVCLTNLAMMHFARHFLESATHLPRFNRLGRGMEGLNLVLAIATPMLPYVFISKAAVGLALVNVLVIMSMGLVSLKSGFKPARYFVTAWIVLLIGVIAAALKAFGLLPHNFFTEYSFQIGSYIEIVLLSMALADRMQQLKEASITDVLTKTYNRRHFDTRFTAEFERVQGRETYLSLIILDIDHFKQFNDRYGHATGDQALKTVAGTIKGMLRDNDSLYRYGGEEFVALLPNTTAHHALQVAERMRHAVSNLVLEGEPLSISLGITTFDGHNLSSRHEMLATADTALYSAKEQGRNCSVHTQDMVHI